MCRQRAHTFAPEPAIGPVRSTRAPGWGVRGDWYHVVFVRAMRDTQRGGGFPSGGSGAQDDRFGSCARRGSQDGARSHRPEPIAPAMGAGGGANHAEDRAAGPGWGGQGAGLCARAGAQRSTHAQHGPATGRRGAGQGPGRGRAAASARHGAAGSTSAHHDRRTGASAHRGAGHAGQGRRVIIGLLR